MANKYFENMPNISFRLMTLFMDIKDLLYPTVGKRSKTFGIREGMTVVDYGCGPGRYTICFAQLIGRNGKVIAIDVQPLAIETINRIIKSHGFENIEPVLAKGYDTGLPNKVADMVFALDMFFGLGDPTAFLREVHRITKSEGILVLDDGHQSRGATLRKISTSNLWKIVEETRDYIKCLPLI